MKITREIIQKILSDAVKAPSGDNAQPWRFAVKENTILVCNVPEKDTSLFNTDQVSNYIAIGALLENLTISAKNSGAHSEITFFPSAEDKNVIAKVTLTDTEPTKENLYDAIGARASNRRKYYLQEIEAEKIAALTLLSSYANLRIEFVRTQEGIAEISHAVSAGEKIALENKNIHDFLFQHVTWSKKDEEKRHGFYIKTFEFKPPQEILFKLFSNWNILRLFHSLGIADFIAKDMESVYRSSGAFGAILIHTPSEINYVKCGMLLERIWLTATTLGLSMQPTSSVHLLANALEKSSLPGLSKMHQNLVSERNMILKKVFTVGEDEVIAFVFRIGYAEPASGRTTRAEPRITWE